MDVKSLLYDDSVAASASEIVKAEAGTIFSITGYSARTTAQFIQLHNAAALPIDTAIPAVVFKAQALSNFYYDFEELGRFCLNGIVVCNSSSISTKTIGSADCWFNCQFK